MSRETALDAEFEQKLLACVHCGFCLSACPTYTRLGDEADSPRGRLYLMRAVHEDRLTADDPAVQKHLDQCLGCRACEPVCPSGVQYGWLLERIRDRIAQEAGMSVMARLLLLSFGNKTLSRITSLLGRAARSTGIPTLLARVLPHRFGRAKFAMAMLAATGPTRSVRASGRQGIRALSKPANKSGFTPRRPDAPMPRGEKGPTQITLLLGCVQEGLFARVNRATERVLKANGFDIAAAPGQGCCGALHAHSGDLEGARALARHNIEAFERSGAEYVVVNAAGCGAVMKEYGELLAHDEAWSARADALAARVRDVSEFLAEIGIKQGAPLPMRVTYDAPCHLHHAQRITRAPLDLLRTIPELELVPLPRADECCAGAGIYGLLHQDLGGRILRDKVEAVRSTKAELVATPNPGCMMQIGAGLIIHGESTGTVHPIELIDESYRRAGLTAQ